MIKKIVNFSLILMLSILFFSCETKNIRNEKAIAEVGSKKLYLSDIEEYFNGLSEKDSVMALTSYINRWAKNQVVLMQAEKNLPEDEKNLEIELDAYRTSLLIHKYEQMYIRNKMDTAVNQKEIEQFYNENPDNFKPPGILIKALFLKIPNDSKHLDKIRLLYRSNREKDFDELDKIAVQGAEIYTTFNNKLVEFSEITAPLPGTADSYENQIIRRKYIEDSDDKFTYFVKANEIVMKEAVAPLEHVKSKIINIILNRRKTELIRRMESELFSNAINNNEVKFYNK